MYYHDMQNDVQIKPSSLLLILTCFPRLQFEILSFSGMHITVANASRFGDGRYMSTFFKVLPPGLCS